MIRTIDEKTALVIIDLQKGIALNPAVKEAQNAIKKANVLLDGFHRSGLPVILVHVDPSQGAWSYARGDQSMGLPRDPEQRAEIHKKMDQQGFFDFLDDLHRQESDIEVLKYTWNAFFETGLHEKLTELGVSQIVLAGISTSIGVEGTARAASEFGYQLSFPIDAMADSHEAAHEHSIKMIFPRIGEVGTTDDVIGLLQ